MTSNHTIHDAPTGGWPWRRWRLQVFLLALLWTGLNGLDSRSWLVGLPCVLLGATLATALQRGPTPQIRWSRLPGLAYFFLRESLRSGWRVARRVLHPRLPVKPGFILYETTLPGGPARVLFLTVTSLLPGTLSAGAEGARVWVHALDVRDNVKEELQELEQRVAQLFDSGRGAP